MSVRIINDTTCTDPWRNLALEECLLNRCGRGDALLYLWQNAATVVIGRHQNPWKECRTAQLEQEGGKLARRITGGGAVYHDLGNLNFSFIAGRDAYDVVRHLAVVIAAVRSVGIEAEFSGRNDILSAGRKFSGNAFAHRTNASLHHGTLLISVDMAMLGRYLQPPQAKIASKGIQSVQSRVVNLSELNGRATVESMRRAMAGAFRGQYGPCAESDPAELIDPAEFESILERQRSWEWRYGQTPRFDASLEARFPWGGVELNLTARDGHVAEAQVFSDAMDEAFITKLEQVVMAVPYSAAALAGAVRTLARAESDDIAAWLENCSF